MSRVLAYLDAVKAGLERSSLGLKSVTVHLDPLDLSDIAKESFATPAARVTLLRGAPVRNPDRSLDIDCAVAIAVLAKKVGAVSADVAVLELAVGVTELVDGNRWGLTMIGQPRETQFRGAAQDVDSKGLSVQVVGFAQKLHRVTVGHPALRGAVDVAGRPIPSAEPPGFAVNGTAVPDGDVP